MTWLLAIVALGLLVTVHEFGHFLAAKAVGMEVELFSVGFGPPIPGLKWHWWGTEFRLSWFLLGGYVKIKGAEPAEDATNSTAPQDPTAYEAQPAWKRIIVVAAGPGINYAFALALALGIFLVKGIPVQPASYPLRIDQVAAGRPAAKAGLRAGDVILAVDGLPVRSYEAYKQVIAQYLQGCRPAPKGARFLDLRVVRAGSERIIHFKPPNEGLGPGLLAAPPLLAALIPGLRGLWVLSDWGPLRAGDHILQADGHDLPDIQRLERLVERLRRGYRCRKNAERALVLTILRRDRKQTIKVYPDENGLIGVVFQEAVVWEKAPVGQRLLLALDYPVEKTKFMAASLWGLVTSLASGSTKAASQVSGPVGIVVVIKTRMKQGFLAGLSVVMLLSVMLGFFNIVPLPALDGGHLFFRLVELLTGRRLSPATEAKIHYYGLMALLGLFVLVTVKDCRSLFGL